MVKELLKEIKKIIRLSVYKAKWRKHNCHNFTTVGNIFPHDKVKVGKMTYGEIVVKTYGNPNEFLKIGAFCSIAGNVKFLLGGEHLHNTFSTYPFKKFVLKSREETITKGVITIESDVWIGENTIVLSGITIGQGAIVAAGSIVHKNIPPYAIYAGGSVKKYRFDNKVIENLLNIDFDLIDEKLIKDNIELLYQEISLKNNHLDKVFSSLSKLDSKQ